MSSFAVVFNQFLSWLSILAVVFFVIVILSLVFRRIEICKRFLSFIKNFTYRGVFVLALAGVVGSLIYSEFIGFEPCVLCWWQRVFLYPIAILLFAALIKKEKVIADYILSLSIPGGLVALYHSIIQITGSSSIFCSGSVSDCSVVYFKYFGFVTLPFMAFSLFALITAFLLVDKVKI